MIAGATSEPGPSVEPPSVGPPSVEPLRRLARDVRARIRLARASRVGVSLGAIGLAGVAIAVTLDRLVGLPAEALAGLVALGVGVPLGGALVSASRRIPVLLPAAIIDRTHALSGRVSIALDLASSASDDALSRLAISDAVSRASRIAPARAFPLRAPRDLRALALALCAVAPTTAAAIRIGISSSEANQPCLRSFTFIQKSSG